MNQRLSGMEITQISVFPKSYLLTHFVTAEGRSKSRGRRPLENCEKHGPRRTRPTLVREAHHLNPLGCLADQEIRIRKGSASGTYCYTQ